MSLVSHYILDKHGHQIKRGYLTGSIFKIIWIVNYTLSI